MQVSDTTLLGWTLLGSKGRHTEHDRYGFHKLFVISLYISWFCHLSPVLKIMLRGRAKRNRSSRSPLGAWGIHGILYQNQKKESFIRTDKHGAIFAPKLWRPLALVIMRYYTRLGQNFNVCLYEENVTVAQKKLYNKISGNMAHLIYQSDSESSCERGLHQVSGVEKKRSLCYCHLQLESDHWWKSWHRGNPEASGLWLYLHPMWHLFYSWDEFQSTTWSHLSLFCYFVIFSINLWIITNKVQTKDRSIATPF